MHACLLPKLQFLTQFHYYAYDSSKLCHAAMYTIARITERQRVKRQLVCKWDVTVITIKVYIGGVLIGKNFISTQQEIVTLVRSLEMSFRFDH